MNVLVIYTHPHRKSLNGAFLERTLQGLDRNEKVNDVEVLDLYKEQFDPLLKFNEEMKRRDMYKDPSMDKYRAQIDKADVIVFIYPIWWGRPPAMLLGYIDKLFASGFAYKQEPGKMLPEGLLSGKKTICISTMKGPTAYPRFFLANAHKVLMKKALFNFVGIKNVKFFEFGSMEKKEGNQIKHLDKIEKYMSSMAS
ncbi:MULTISPECIES: NAD(P)H-dependent oxidoreductase [unclassified Oceanispirochaeta]|uniref:NAD(P)H-dependent oxidoreductase n=1 Tax=unclassified Oceanispirochaeta TaxID=2635722 RepID=UPI000E0903C4|nr:MULTISPECIES: NAD(P)H-dependent oxidoreductase [unclassified Oceanispirochaeta]MBF9016308.1 NAD(P)H-dependent oxidoreductase [Oceanispirochaeta sp. M2]NPD72771.1 NAD(P)H-dependent oxidoreductase [Oceanispirochaeta sp. M1]RDG31616.1 flavodoxin family protein [Oceanispirochaeta sp. M1]